MLKKFRNTWSLLFFNYYHLLKNLGQARFPSYLYFKLFRYNYISEWKRILYRSQFLRKWLNLIQTVMNSYSERPDVTFVVKCWSMSFGSGCSKTPPPRSQIFVKLSTESKVSKFCNSFIDKNILRFNVSVDEMHPLQNS